MLEVISIILLAIGLPILIMGIIIIGIRRILEIEIIKNFLLRFKNEEKINQMIEREKKINDFILRFLIFLIMYIVSYPVIFILMIRDLVIKRNTPEITNKTRVNFYVIFIPLLLI
tara:strand:- start:451 stop:795 length:345 start_codon:yes stop_codon:yes gene_type:complete